MWRFICLKSGNFFRRGGKNVEKFIIAPMWQWQNIVGTSKQAVLLIMRPDTHGMLPNYDTPPAFLHEQRRLSRGQF
jgi:hypothetical protein